MTRILRPPSPTAPTELTPALGAVFHSARQSLAAGEPVAVVVHAGDILGHGEPVAAAFVTGLVGMARAVAFEGVKDGWRMNVVARSAKVVVTDDEVVAAVSDTRLSGQVVVLDTSLLGKVLP